MQTILGLAIVPEAFTNPGLVSELPPAFFRIDQFNQTLPLDLGIPRSELTHTQPIGPKESLSTSPIEFTHMIYEEEQERKEDILKTSFQRKPLGGCADF